MSIPSGRRPLLYWLWGRETILGRLDRTDGSGGVVTWLSFDGVGVCVRDRVWGPEFEFEFEFDSSDSGIGGANDPLLDLALSLMLSMSTLKNGSGSKGSKTSLSSARLGLCGLAGFEGVNVTCGNIDLVGVVARSAISNFLTDGGASTSVIVTSSSSGLPILILAVASTCRRISGEQRLQSSPRTSPLIIKHSTVVIDRTVAVLLGANARLATSPKYCPCFSRGRM